ncbi:MAG TPA: glycosyltransferase [Acidimicrobiia bacterium]
MSAPLSVVVPTRDRPELLETCLTFLRSSLRDGDELIVVDSASADERVASVAVAHGATYVRAERPGASHARNLGWRRAAHDIVAFVDDDVRVSPRWAGAVAEAMAPPDRSFVVGRVEVPPEQGLVERPVAIRTGDDGEVLTPGTTGTVGHSANLAVRRPWLDGVGGFDELLGAGGRFRAAEDNDLFDRLFAAGGTGWYEPTALGWHDQWRDRREKLRIDLAYGVGSGARFRKLAVTDRSRLRHTSAQFLWHDGLVPLARAVRRNYRFGMAVRSLRLIGTALGFVAAWTCRVEEGHLRRRRRATNRS